MSDYFNNCSDKPTPLHDTNGNNVLRGIVNYVMSLVTMTFTGLLLLMMSGHVPFGENVHLGHLAPYFMIALGAIFTRIDKAGWWILFGGLIISGLMGALAAGIKIQAFDILGALLVLILILLQYLVAVLALTGSIISLVIDFARKQGTPANDDESRR